MIDSQKWMTDIQKEMIDIQKGMGMIDIQKGMIDIQKGMSLEFLTIVCDGSDFRWNVGEDSTVDRLGISGPDTKLSVSIQ